MRNDRCNRRTLLGGLGAYSLIGPHLARARPVPAISATISDTVLDDILKAGNWSASADDNADNERLPEAAARRWIAAALGNSSRQAVADLGALALTLSVAERGVAWDGSIPTDPAGTNSRGPGSIMAGKHAMSYALGGIGLPHLDVEDGVAFFRQLSKLLPGKRQLTAFLQRLPADFHYDRIRAAGGLCGGHHGITMADPAGEPFNHAAVIMAGRIIAGGTTPGLRTTLLCGRNSDIGRASGCGAAKCSGGSSTRGSIAIGCLPMIRS